MMTTIVRACLLFLVIIQIMFIGSICADVLLPPTKIPFANDVIIKRYAHEQPLNKLFRYTGKWEVKYVNNKLSFVGTSDEKPAYLISLDKLSRKPKSFKLDYVVQGNTKEYGFIYGEIGVIIKNDKLYPAVFDEESNMLKIDSSSSKIIENLKENESNTLDINTGYDPTGGPKLGCTIYINGIGLSFDCPYKDSPFGVYLYPQSSITINNIRWTIGYL